MNQKSTEHMDSNNSGVTYDLIDKSICVVGVVATLGFPQSHLNLHILDNTHPNRMFTGM